MKTESSYVQLRREFDKACGTGDLKTVKRLHASGFDIHRDDDFVLRWACDSGQLNIVKYLLENGANLHKSTIYWAGQRGHYHVADYLTRYERNQKLKKLLEN